MLGQAKKFEQKNKKSENSSNDIPKVRRLAFKPRPFFRDKGSKWSKNLFQFLFRITVKTSRISDGFDSNRSGRRSNVQIQILKCVYIRKKNILFYNLKWKLSV